MIELIQDGNVTSPLGFLAGGTYAGLKAPGDEVLDLGVLISETQASILQHLQRIMCHPHQ